MCIRDREDPNRFRFNNEEFYCKSGEEMQKILGEFPGAIENTQKIAERCNVTLTFGEHRDVYKRQIIHCLKEYIQTVFNR